MELIHAIRERPTVHRFNDTPIPRQSLIEIANDAVWAPNHGMREPRRFVEIVKETSEPMYRLVAEWYEKNKAEAEADSFV
ncbi:Nitroreductase family protein [Paenibacillus konkukensis]|uniref:Nitroreductase family protein n=1 Tax=Paenibacillus konkukensis TaxID=2020716 RepID=A0ABY4RIA8_9BACL|nr:nitroreductase family protein [Paenibacillus konkukensis]UQZ81253.1 Nitroreductase family protein [Paenibacillus konkukensis]